jgi:hypothetical protein
LLADSMLILVQRGKSKGERQWDANRKKGRGRPMKNKGNWESMSAPSVRFLHWVGFDPRSALPPPNEETTEALAFLGYDFMGRIVEKVGHSVHLSIGLWCHFIC